MVKMDSVSCTVDTEYVNIIQVNYCLYRKNINYKIAKTKFPQGNICA
jgi:hypothetical protein